MAVTSLTILAPADGQDFSATLRPHTNVLWVGGTGPFDVVYEWDTVTTFDSVNLISDSNTGVTGTTDEGTPPSDMGPYGTDWYLRVSITDTSDNQDEIQTIDFGQSDAVASHTASGYPIANTIDGSTGTEWRSGTSMASMAGTLDYQFGAAVQLDKIVLLQNHASDYAGSVEVFYSDNGTSWTSVGTFSSLISGSNDLTFTAATHRWWRVKELETKSAGWRCQLMTFWDGATEKSVADETVTGGTWRLSYDGNATGDLDDQISFAALETAVEALTGITAVTVTGTVGLQYVVEITDPSQTDMLMLVVDDNSLTPTAVGIDIVETEKGRVATPTIAPGTGYYTVNFVDPTDHAGFLYLNANIGVNFGVDGVGDGDPNLFSRYLYLNSNVTSGQPCPWIDTIAPTIQSQGSPITIMGAGFGALVTTYGGEVRLYDSSGYSGSYVTMSTTSWSDTEISATVPSGASSGWVTLVHTTGTPSCTGSNQKLLTVTQTEADPEAGWWVEIVDHKNVTIQAAQPHVVSARIAPVMNDIGTGRLDVPLSDQDLDELIDPDNHIGRFARVYLDQRYRYGFYLQNLRHDVTDDGGSIAALEGEGMEGLARWGVVYPHDHPSNPSLAPTWIYGSTDNLIPNPGFEDDAQILTNPGGEDGNDDDGNAIGWSKDGGNISSLKCVNDSLAAREGDWYFSLTTSLNHSGMTQSISCEPNRVYHFRVYAKDPTAAGMRLTLRVEGASDMTKTSTYANNYEWSDGIYAELGNVARNVANNGCPGGATDGTWQVMDVEVLTGSEQTSLSVYVQDDHHSVCAAITRPPAWYVDSVTVEGWGLGLDPWKSRAPSTHDTDSFRLSELHAISSEHTCYVGLNAPTGGIEQTVAVNPNTKYTLTGYLYALAADGVWNLDIVSADGVTVLSQDSHTPTASTHNQYQTTYTTAAGEDGIIVRLTYQGSGNPSGVYVENFSLVPGKPVATPGTILADLLAPIQARGTIDWLDLTSFTATHDSVGNVWYSSVALDISPGETLKQVLDRFVALGYEWEIVPVNFAEGGDTGAQLNVFNSRSFGSGIGFDRTLSEADSIVLEAGRNSISGGRVNKRVFTQNKVFAIDQDGNWSEAESTDYASDKPAYGRIEGYLQATVGNTSTLSDFASSRITDAEDSQSAIAFDFARDDSLRPFLHFGVGDSVFVDPTPRGDRTTKRIRAIVADLAGEGTKINFDVNLSKVIFEDQAAVIAAISQLKERAPGENTGAGTGRVGSSASGFVTTTIVSETAAPHTHKLDSAEIRNKALSGDVTGTLPGPVTVQRIRGQNVSAAIPADTGGYVVWAYDRDLLWWVPTEIATLTSQLTTKGDLHAYSTEDTRLPVGVDDLSLTADSSAATGLAWVGHLPLAGGTLTGDLTLSADPTNVLHAATKQYVDQAETDANTYSNGLDHDHAAPIATHAAVADSHHTRYADSEAISALSTADVYVKTAGDAMTGPLLADYGTAAAPGVAFDGDPDTGMYQYGANQLGLVAGGSGGALITATDITSLGQVTGQARIMIAGSIGASQPTYNFVGDTDTGPYLVSADRYGISAGGNSIFEVGLVSGALQMTASCIYNRTTGSAANVHSSSTSSLVLRSTSARKYKTDIVYDVDYLADCVLKPAKFFREDDRRTFLGFIADDLGGQDELLGEYDVETGEIENFDNRAVMAVLAAKINRLEKLADAMQGEQ